MESSFGRDISEDRQVHRTCIPQIKVPTFVSQRCNGNVPTTVPMILENRQGGLNQSSSTFLALWLMGVERGQFRMHGRQVCMQQLHLYKQWAHTYATHGNVAHIQHSPAAHAIGDMCTCSPANSATWSQKSQGLLVGYGLGVEDLWLK